MSLFPIHCGFFAMPVLDLVIKAMTLTILFPAISGVSHVILRKELKFKTIAGITIIISIISGIVGILLAFSGWGVWAPCVAINYQFFFKNDHNTKNGKMEAFSYFFNQIF